MMLLAPADSIPILLHAHSVILLNITLPPPPPGLLTELFVKPGLLKTAYHSLTRERKRVIEDTIEEIRKEVEKMLSLRAIKTKQKKLQQTKREVFVVSQQPPPDVA